MKTLSAALLATAVTILGTPVTQAETLLKAVSPFPANQIFAKEFSSYVARINAATSGGVRVRVLGGPEAIPAPQQAAALRNGVIDLLFSPASFYRGQMPEVDAFSGSNMLPWETRENGGFELISKIYGERLNAKLLAWTGTGFGYHIYLRSEPKRTADGGFDLKALKIRSAPMYREFFHELGVVNVALQIPEIYSALERGVINGFGWPALGIADLGWNRFVRFRLDPSFLAGDAVVIINLNTWNGMSPHLQDVIAKESEIYERDAVAFYQRELAAEDDRLKSAGMSILSLQGTAKQNFLDLAYEEVWKRLNASGTPHSAELRRKFYR